MKMRAAIMGIVRTGQIEKEKKNMRKVWSTAMAMAIAAGISGTAMAAEGSFTDIPKDHWSYAAVDQLVKDGIIEGNGDGTFAGDRPMSRYEMAAVIARAEDHIKTVNPADQALIEKLGAEYKTELQDMQAKNDAHFQELSDKVDRVQLSGFVRAKYDHDDAATSVGAENNNKHFYMNLEGKMKVGKIWEGHFQSETRKGYTTNQSWRSGNSDSSDQDGTFQRIWVEGRPGVLGVTAGTKWWGYGFQNVPFGHAADGAQLDLNFAKTWNVKGFYLRPRQGDLVTMPDGTQTYIRGLNLTGRIGTVDTSFTYACNQNHKQTGNNQMMSRMGAVDLRVPLAKNVTFTGTYVRTNAYDFKNSKEIRLDYKGTDLKKVGSFGLYTRLFDFEKYGDMSHDDEWCSLPADTKGYIVGVKYVPYENVEWETFYSGQKKHHVAAGVDDSRKLLRTQIDFHF